MRSIRVCERGIIGPPLSPCSTRQTTRRPKDGARPQSAEQAPKLRTAIVNTRTAPNLAASQPVSGTVIASATE